MIEEFELDKGLVFTGSQYCFTGRVEVLSLDESKEEGLRVYLTNDNGMSWEENWNTAHVAAGFNRGDYLVTPCENCDGTGKVRRNFTNDDGNYVLNKETCPDCGGDGISRMIDFGKSDEELDEVESNGTIAEFADRMLTESKSTLDTLKNEVFTLTNPYGNDVYDMDSLDRVKPLTRGHYEGIRTEAKIGRNEDCPCGSGKKYKKCCIS